MACGLRVAALLLRPESVSGAGTRAWRGREILGALCCCAAISAHCATQPTVRATANRTVNMLTGTCRTYKLSWTLQRPVSTGGKSMSKTAYQ